MAFTITAIAAFQLYWLQKAYDREKRAVEMRANLLFRETVRSVQASKLKLDRIINDSAKTSRIIKGRLSENTQKKIPNQKMEGMVDVLMQKIKDSSKKKITVTKNNVVDTQYVFNKGFSARRNRLIQFLFDLDSLQDSVKVKELQTSFSRHLNEQNLSIPFTISRVSTRATDEPVFNELTLG
ncbi:MAG TPA: hypothetical protein VGO09_02480, partial [Flavisolibacter sp.]|nr:hypothetical protein [Flavisolibacter sp.]